MLENIPDDIRPFSRVIANYGDCNYGAITVTVH